MRTATSAIAAATKLRRFFWTRLQNNVVKETVFASVPETEYAVQPDLEKLFACATAAEEEPETARPAKARTHQILRPERAQRIEIMLSVYGGASHAALCDAVLRLDEEVLTLERLRRMMQQLPNEEEWNAINAYSGPKEALGPAERFCVAISSVPFLNQRLHGLAFKLALPGLVEDLHRALDTIERACSELRSSAEVRHMLAVVLRVGNYLNSGGTGSGAAKGFRFSSCVKLVDTKSADKSTTLLHYVASVLEQFHPEALHLAKALPHAGAASRLTFDGVEAQLADVNQNLTAFRAELAAHRSREGLTVPNDKFLDVMGPWEGTAVGMCGELASRMEHVRTQWTGLPAFFGEEEGMGMGDFFGHVYEFSQMLAKAHRDNQRELAIRERKKKRAADAAASRRVPPTPLARQLSPRTGDVPAAHLLREGIRRRLSPQLAARLSPSPTHRGSPAATPWEGEGTVDAETAVAVRRGPRRSLGVRDRGSPNLKSPAVSSPILRSPRAQEEAVRALRLSPDPSCAAVDSTTAAKTVEAVANVENKENVCS